MGSLNDGQGTLPDAGSPSLHLSHPTDEENFSLWNTSSSTWKEALTEQQYLEESAFLKTIPLARGDGMTEWVLVDKDLALNRRALLASCESFRKRSLVSDTEGKITETITQGIAAVYCDPKYRGRGYASRLMEELSKVLPQWQVEHSNTSCVVVASVLYSDIGKNFYSALGWRSFPSYHIEFDPVAQTSTSTTTGVIPILAGQLGQLCQEDEAMVRMAMALPSTNAKIRFMILPDHDHMMWHHQKEEFVSQKLFGKQPLIKGALAGQPGNRVWAIWTHRFYGPIDVEETSSNTLYILRLVIENQAILNPLSLSGRPFDKDKPRDGPVEELRAVLEAAQAEAAEWKLKHVKLWDPSPQVEELIRETGIRHRREDREEEGICSLQWYGMGNRNEDSDSLEWIGKEKYCWC